MTPSPFLQGLGLSGCSLGKRVPGKMVIEDLGEASVRGKEGTRVGEEWPNLSHQCA